MASESVEEVNAALRLGGRPVFTVGTVLLLTSGEHVEVIGSYPEDRHGVPFRVCRMLDYPRRGQRTAEILWVGWREVDEVLGAPEGHLPFEEWGRV